jgi:RNA polymerase sigma-70 factor (ECF subfamily)
MIRGETAMIQDDAALVAQVLSGEKSAFGPLIDRHRPRAIRLARRMLGGAADAEDVVQEALLQASLCLRDLRMPERFGAWRSGIVVNLSRMSLRARHDVYTLEDWYGGRVVQDFTWADIQPSPEAVYEAHELHGLVLAAIDTLPHEQQQAVRLHDLDGLTLCEIGLLAGVPVGMVKARLHRARARRREVARAVADARVAIASTEEGFP